MKTELETINGFDVEVGNLTESAKAGALITAFLMHRTEAKCAEMALSDAKRELTEFMAEKGLDRMRVDDVRIDWVPSTRVSFDEKAFKADHPELWEKYRKEIEVRAVRVAAV